MFGIVMLSIVMLVAILLATVYIKKGDVGGAAALYSVATLAFFANIFVVVPDKLGYGYVPNKTEEFTKRFDSGVAYELTASVKYDSDQIILVKEMGTGNFYALRVKEIPPKYFALVGGNPVAIAQTAPLPATSYPPINKRGMGLW